MYYHMSVSLAPIVLFVYNRPDHTKKTIEALQKNIGAGESDLFIYSDAPKNPSAETGVTTVRSYLKTITGFKQITVIERDVNWGLEDSIVNGVTSVVREHGKVIVLEDDIVTSPYFLRFMNDALTLYADVSEVMHVSGYFFPVPPTEAIRLPETFFYNQTSCWGWGTWHRAWKTYRNDAEGLLKDIVTSGRLREFDMDGHFRFSSTLRANADGRLRTWAIKWHASVFLCHGLCLHPRQSLVQNIGHDGSGTHGNRDNRYVDHAATNDRPVAVTVLPLIENQAARLSATRFLTTLRPSLLTRLIHRFRLW